MSSPCGLVKTGPELVAVCHLESHPPSLACLCLEAELLLPCGLQGPASPPGRVGHWGALAEVGGREETRLDSSSLAPRVAAPGGLCNSRKAAQGFPLSSPPPSLWGTCEWLLPPSTSGLVAPCHKPLGELHYVHLEFSSRVASHVCKQFLY